MHFFVHYSHALLISTKQYILSTIITVSCLVFNKHGHDGRALNHIRLIVTDMYVATLPFKMSSVLKATTENKTSSVTTHFNKLKQETTYLLAQLFCKVSVTSCSFYIKCMFNVSAVRLDDALKPATPMSNGTINETLQHTLDKVV